MGLDFVRGSLVAFLARFLFLERTLSSFWSGQRRLGRPKTTHFRRSRTLA